MKLNLLWTFGQLLSVLVDLIWVSNIWIHRKSIWLYINFRFSTLYAHGWRWNWLKTLSALLWFISCHIQTFCFFFVCKFDRNFFFCSLSKSNKITFFVNILFMCRNRKKRSIIYGILSITPRSIRKINSLAKNTHTSTGTSSSCKRSKHFVYVIVIVGVGC